MRLFASRICSHAYVGRNNSINHRLKFLADCNSYRYFPHKNLHVMMFFLSLPFSHSSLSFSPFCCFSSSSSSCSLSQWPWCWSSLIAWANPSVLSGCLLSTVMATQATNSRLSLDGKRCGCVHSEKSAHLHHPINPPTETTKNNVSWTFSEQKTVPYPARKVAWGDSSDFGRFGPPRVRFDQQSDVRREGEVHLTCLRHFATIVWLADPFG